MNDRVPPRTTRLYWENVQMMILCGLTAFWLLASPLVPYAFDIGRLQGLLLFTALQVLITATLGAVGVTLNRLTSRGARVTLYSVRMALRRNRRR